MGKDILIYAAGGFGRELAWLADSCGDTAVAFIDDNPAKHGTVLNDIPVISLDDAVKKHRDAEIVVAIGSPTAREAVTNKAMDAGFRIGSLVHPRVERSTWIEYGEGCVICAGCILTTNIKVGNHVQINLDCTIGHDVILGDYSTLAPGVHVSGCVHLGRRTYVGTGAVILNGTIDQPVVIGDAAVVGGAACVNRSVEPGVTVVGIPARPLPPRT